MTWIGRYNHGNTTDTTYAKPSEQSDDPSWGADVVAESKNSANQRNRTYASLADNVEYIVFLQAGGSPAATDTMLADMSQPVVAAINSDSTQQTLQSNVASTKSSVEAIAIPVPPSTSDLVTAINNDATQTTARTNAATAAAEVVKIHRAASAVTAGGSVTRRKVSASETTLVETLE